VTLGRILLLALLASGAMAFSAISAAELAQKLAVPGTANPQATPSDRDPAPKSRHAARRPSARTANEPAARRHADPTRAFRRSRAQAAPRLLGLSLPLLVAGEVAVGALSLAGLGGTLIAKRVRSRGRREYALYELHLSPHDEAKPQDLDDMMEAIANVVRAFPAERARSGQPFLAFELLHGTGPSGALEWSLGVRCEPRVAVALDAAISAAYPDVRLGHRVGETPQPRDGSFREPPQVMRFTKQRSFVYPLVASGDERASPPLEAIAHAQVAAGTPSVIRFQLTPAPAVFDSLARAVYRRHENRLVRQERWGLPEGGLTSTLNRAEMANAERTQNRSLLWLEAVVAADTPETCKQLAAAIQARRGENRLRRRWMLVRTNLYRRRFATATPPLLPSPRSLVSAAEVAHLLALPSARMKGVPVRRNAVPRIPMPPEILRADPGAAVPAPADPEVPSSGTKQCVPQLA
jgi:hypothetical protein